MNHRLQQPLHPPTWMFPWKATRRVVLSLIFVNWQSWKHSIDIITDRNFIELGEMWFILLLKSQCMFSCNVYIVVNGLRTNTCVISINNQGRGKCFGHGSYTYQYRSSSTPGFAPVTHWWEASALHFCATQCTVIKSGDNWESPRLLSWTVKVTFMNVYGNFKTLDSISHLTRISIDIYKQDFTGDIQTRVRIYDERYVQGRKHWWQN